MGGSIQFRKLTQGLRARRKAGLIFLLAAVLLTGFWNSLPSPLFHTPYSTLVVGRDGRLLSAHIAADEQWRFPAGTDVPERFRIALLQYEDKRFYSHPGIDGWALARALYLNMKHGRVVSGASTITMQTIRLVRKNPGRSYAEKLIEMILALRLELSYSKQEILGLYASHAPFGGNVVGLEAAAWRYFGRSAKQLTWAEACMLAVLPNQPSLIHPGRNRTLLKAKRDGLLGRLHEAGILNDLDFKLAKQETLPAAPRPMPELAGHLLQTLAKKHGAGAIYRTTLDTDLQRDVAGIVQRHSRKLNQEGVHNAAVMVVDNDSFNVLAYIGNSDGELADGEGYALDLNQRPRSSGSILKPLLFATMIQQGEILPDTLVADLPTQYDGYMPQNYDKSFRGAVPAKEALARSLNIPAVRMLKRHGVDRFYDFLRHMGMTTLFRVPDGYGLSLILGGAEATVWDMAGIYANLAHIAKLHNAMEQTHYRPLQVLENEDLPTGREREIQPAAAWMTLQALLEVTRPGDEGYWKSFSSARKIAWKTGTSYGLRDAWAIGNSSRYTVAVWVGNASGEGRPGLTGLNRAAPVMFDIFNRLPKAAWFKKPLHLMKEVEICADDGFLSNGRCKTRKTWIPKESDFDRVSKNNILVHLDKSGLWRVHGGCEPVSAMRHANWFVLPPGEEYFYRKRNATYRSLPPYRKDCIKGALNNAADTPIDILYPSAGASIYIPIELAEKKGNVVLKAVHRDTNTTLYWHLNDRFIGETREFHQQSLYLEPGRYLLTLVDSDGYSVKRWFTVLGKK